MDNIPGQLVYQVSKFLSLKHILLIETMSTKLQVKLQGTLSALRHILRKHHRFESQATTVEQTKSVIKDISTPTLYGFKKTGVLKYNLLTKKMINVAIPMERHLILNYDRSSWVCYRIHRVLILSADTEGNDGNCFIYND